MSCMDSMFDKALYYPTVEIKNEGWLKSAILFWNRIETLVPESMDSPYKKRTELLLEEAGLLYPHRIDPYSSMTDGVMSNFEPSFFGKGKSTDFRKVKSTP